MQSRQGAHAQTARRTGVIGRFAVEPGQIPQGVPQSLFQLAELDVGYDEAHNALWTFMCPPCRPSFTPSMLADFELWQELIALHFGPPRTQLDYLILGSHWPGVFSFGGDLELFQRLIRNRDHGRLADYGYRCVEILHRNFHALDLPMLTIGLVQGQALGGGFEALLSFDMIIAERGATFGFPETMFGLFPGMGAHALLSRKLGTALADRLILSNQTHTAEQMHELGVVSLLAEPGRGVEAIREFMTKSARRHAGLVAARKATRVSMQVELARLYAIVDHWVDAALQLEESDLKLLSRLAAVQARTYHAAV